MKCMKDKDGKETSDAEMNKNVREHLEEVSGSNNDHIENLKVLDINDVNIEEILHIFKRVKAETFDGVSYHWFILHKKCKENLEKRCEICKRKVRFMQSCFDQEYWNTEDSKRHLIANLICLNKDHPKDTEYGNFRPIKVQSPVIKLIEGAILNKIRYYCENNLQKEQIGFMRGLETKTNLLKILNNYHLKFSKSDDKHWFWLFLDWKSAFDRLI